MTAIIHHEARHDHLALVFAERERRGMWKPSLFGFSPRGIETRKGGDAAAAPSRSDESPSRRARHNIGGSSNAR